jgi:hypothetical protein
MHLTGKQANGVFTLTSRTQFDHFADAGKMVALFVTRFFAGSYGTLNGFLETPPLALAQQRRNETEKPQGAWSSYKTHRL